jgi:putative membrane protein
MTGALVAYVHYAAMVFIALLLVFELQACVPGLPAARMRYLARVDLLYMVAAVLALATGVLRVVWFGQGAGFYLHNPVFYIKLALFAAVGLLSIPPTLQYLRWMRALKSGGTAFAEPWQVARVRRYLVAELVLFALIPLMAVLMARGIGIQAAAS